jgi:iron complex outermembrane receptor protein
VNPPLPFATCRRTASPAASSIARVPLAALLACLPAWAAAQQAAEPQQVVVTGSVAQRTADEAPYAISVVGREALRSAGPMVNLSEALAQVPGLVVNNRANYAQDLQISSRGFGARAGFGVRGIRLYTDGIPASGPDGQGQVSNFDLAGAQRVEVLRGPFSVLYGNSSGGVIALFSAPVRGTEAEGEADVGSFGLHQARVSLGTPLGDRLGLRASLSTFSVDGFRPHSAADKRLGNLRGGWQDGADTVTLLVNDLTQNAQDPLGLTRDQFNADPLQTTPEASTFNTRKTLRQTQLGASWRHAFGDGALRDGTLALYSGQRSVTQWQAIPVGSQASPRSGGGVVDFDRAYEGAEARLRWAFTDVDLVAGAATDRQRDARRGFENFTGTGAGQQLGVTGKLRRNEVDRAETADLFAQAEWAISPALNASAGVRSGTVRLSAADTYLANGDDSGSLRFHYTNPVAGLRWQLDKGLQLHASVARGFEAPTLGELAYRPDAAGGLNDALQPQTSRQVEVGAKWRSGAWMADATVFQTRVSNELGVLSNSGGRSTYQNVGHTERKGLELSGAWRPASGWRGAVALTVLDATYQDSFLTCAGTPCKAPTVTVPAGHRIAGTAKHSAWAELAWRDARWGEWGVEARSLSNVAVNDQNSDFAPAYALAALRWTKGYALSGGGRLELLARVDNLLDRRYAGSVIVNDSNGRFFETGAPRSALLGVRLLAGS